MKIKHLLMAAAAMVMAVACNDPVEEPKPNPEPTPEVHDVWGIAGTHQGDSEDTQWKPENSPAMAYADGYYSLTGVELKKGDEFKFVKDNAWTENRGYNGDKPVRANYYYAVVHNGGNIKIEADGTYDIYLNEAADKFYIMEAGKTPADAADAETIVPEPECAATAIISEDYTVTVDAYSATYLVKLTTKDAVKASYMYRLTENVDETYTADYIFIDGTALTEGDTEWDGLNKENFEVEIWLTFELEYTLFLAVEDAEGLTKVVSVNITAPAGPTVYEDYNAKGTATFYSDEFEGDSSVVEFVGAEYKLRIVVNTIVTTEMEYSMYDEEWNNEVYITSAWLMGIDDEPISRLSTGTLGIYDSMWNGQYADFVGTGVDGDGNNIVVRMGCVGLPEGLGGGNSGSLDFEVASAKFYHSAGNEWEIPANDNRYILELTSTDNDFACLVIDNYDSLASWEGETPYLNGQFLAYDPEYPEDACIYLNAMDGSWMMGYVISAFDYLVVTSNMGIGEDSNTIIGMFTAMSHMDGSTKTVNISCPNPIAMYSEGGEGGEVTPSYPTLTEALNINWNGDHYFSYGVIDWADGIGICQLAFGSMSGGGMMGSASLEDCLVLGLYLESSVNGIPAGTYEISETPEYGKAVAGKVYDMSEGMYPGGVWGPYMCSCCAYLGAGYQYMDPTTLASLQAGGSFTEYTAEDCYIAPIVSGTVTVEALGYSEEMGGDLYNITVDGADANGTKVTITITNAPGM